MNIRPRKICLDASTVCQLKCVSCPTASGETGESLGAGFLKFEDFKRMVDENPWIDDIELSNWGEIFLNRELVKILEYGYRHHVVLRAHNGVNLNHADERVLEALVKYRVQAVTCSIDGASQEVYSRYRVNGDFDQVIKNIKTINRFKAQYRSPYPELFWQFVAFGHNEHEIGDARRMAADLNMHFVPKLSWDDLYRESFSPIKNVVLIKRELGLDVANRNEFRERYGKEYLLRGCCHALWTKPQINFDGRVLGCSVNYWGDYGNAFKDGLIRCLNGEKMNDARNVLMGKRQPNSDLPCGQCRQYRTMRDNEDWIKPSEIQQAFASPPKLLMWVHKVLGVVVTNQLRRLWRSIRSGLRAAKNQVDRVFWMPDGPETRMKLTSRIYPIRIPLLPDEKRGWKPHPIFSGSTKGMRHLSCHVSVLNQNRCPHLLHTHTEEEILLLLSGEADLIIPGTQFPFENQRRRLKPGQFVYYPANFSHTLQTVSQAPANYLLFRWRGRRRKIGVVLPLQEFDFFESVEKSGKKEGFCPHLLFEGPTHFLRKLHCHTSKLTPGAAYEPHVDPYDVAIVVLEGEVETLGKRVSPHGVIFYAAGEPHDMRNPGKEPAKYLVFEFHGY